MIGLSVIRRLLDKNRKRRLQRSFKSIGTGVEYDLTTKFIFPERIILGSHLYIGPSVYLNGRGGLQIDDHVIIAPEVVVLTSMHNYKHAEMVPYDAKELLKMVIIERCVWIGMRAIILPGVKIKEGSIVGAGSVVTKSFPPGSIIAGNPAIIVGQRDMARYKTCVDKKKYYLKLKQEFGFEKIETDGNTLEK